MPLPAKAATAALLPAFYVDLLISTPRKDTLGAPRAPHTDVTLALIIDVICTKQKSKGAKGAETRS